MMFCWSIRSLRWRYEARRSSMSATGDLISDGSATVCSSCFMNLRGDYRRWWSCVWTEDCRDVVKEWGVPVRYTLSIPSAGLLMALAHAMYQQMIADDWCVDPGIPTCIWLLTQSPC